MKNSILLEFVLAEIRKSPLTQRQIAESCSVPYSTLTKIIQRTIEDPGVTHVEALAKFFGWQFEPTESELIHLPGVPTISSHQSEAA
jgi:hypothetical protein